MAQTHNGRVEPKSEMMLSTIEKGLRVLEALASKEAAHGLTLTELGRMLDMHRTTLFRFLVTFRANGYIDRDPATDRYRLGMQTLSLAAGLLNNLDARQVARPVLQDVCERTEELCHLTVLDRGEVVTIERVEGTRPLSLQTGIGMRREAYCSAAGKAIMAFLPRTTVDRVLDLNMAPLTPNTITSRAVMYEHLTAIKERGWAWDDEERVVGMRCVAAPVFGVEGIVLGSLSIAAPTIRTSWDRLEALGAEIRQAAETVSRRLGFRGLANGHESKAPQPNGHGRSWRPDPEPAVSGTRD